MKTILMIIAFGATALMANAQSKQFCYVITSNDTVYGTNVIPGYAKTTIKLDSGEKVKIANEEIKAYYVNDVLTKKLPVYINNRPTGKEEWMKLIEYKNSIKVYKLERFNGADESMDAIFSFYHDNKLINTQTNPSLSQIEQFIGSWNNPEKALEDVKPLVSNN